MSEPITYDVQDGIGVLCVNRPGARNALNWAAQERFAEVVAAAAQDPSLRVLIITGAGHQAFVAGGDLKELVRHGDAAGGGRLNRVMGTALAQLTELPIPVMAAVNGDAYGGGCEIITACDLRLAAASAHFQFAQIRNALTTGWGGTARLVRLIGQSRAMELLLTGRTLTSQEAQTIGLVHEVVERGQDVLVVARQWAERLVQLPLAALAANKTLVNADLPLPDAYALETRLFTQLWVHPDHHEAMQAFNEKRPPLFNR
jgi:enoyl-CoA hydratase